MFIHLYIECGVSCSSPSIWRHTEEASGFLSIQWRGNWALMALYGRYISKFEKWSVTWKMMENFGSEYFLKALSSIKKKVRNFGWAFANVNEHIFTFYFFIYVLKCSREYAYDRAPREAQCKVVWNMSQAH